MATQQPRLTLSDINSLDLDSNGLRYVESQVFAGVSTGAVALIEDIYPTSPVQDGMLISQAREPELYWVDISLQLECNVPMTVEKLEEAWRRVDLPSEKGPRGAASKFHVASIDANRVDLTLCVNHVAADATSLGILLRDFSQALDGKLGVQKGPDFRDYIEFRRAERTEASVKYWTEYTREAIPSIFPVLPTPSKPTAEETSAPPSTVVVPIDDFNTLQETCRNLGVTLVGLLHAAWALTLSLYTGEEDVIFGYFADGRDIAMQQPAHAVGVFINALVCRLSVRLDQSVHAFVRAAYDDCLQALPNQFGCSVAEIYHAHGLAGTSLFNTGISLQRSWATTWDGRETQLRGIDWQETNDFALSINAIESPTGLDIAIGFDGNSIDSWLVQQAAGSFAHIISELARSEPNHLLSDLSLVDAKSRLLWMRGMDRNSPRSTARFMTSSMSRRERPPMPSQCLPGMANTRMPSSSAM
ncbi:hypothetical protein MRB53_041983 [Persea americana]|nr:hypothetical protein MRB53_041983 [Persea americana]